jgi:hypothetical protein
VRGAGCGVRGAGCVLGLGLGLGATCAVRGARARCAVRRASCAVEILPSQLTGEVAIISTLVLNSGEPVLASSLPS